MWWVIAGVVLLALIAGAYFYFFTGDQWGDMVQYEPKESMTPEQLFGLLLSANFFLSNFDNFNQLGSSLKPKDISNNLKRWWDVSSAQELMAAIERVRGQLHDPQPEFVQALDAKRNGRPIDSEEYEGLLNLETLLLKQKQLSNAQLGGGRHLNTAAWNIGRLVGLVRWGVSLGYVQPAQAWELINEMAAHAKQHYRSWEEYSLSYLYGRSMWQPMSDPDDSDWQFLANCHEHLIKHQRSAIHQAASW